MLAKVFRRNLFKSQEKISPTRLAKFKTQQTNDFFFPLVSGMIILRGLTVLRVPCMRGAKIGVREEKTYRRRLRASGFLARKGNQPGWSKSMIP